MVEFDISKEIFKYIDKEFDRLEDDCVIAMKLQDYDYLDRLCVVRGISEVGWVASSLY